MSVLIVRYLNLSQAMGREAVSYGYLSCITPGGKYLDLEANEVLHGAVLMALQCIVSSCDVKFDFRSTSERLLCNMSGNACCGARFGTTLLASWSIAGTKPAFRLTRGLSVQEMPPVRLRGKSNRPTHSLVRSRKASSDDSLCDGDAAEEVVTCAARLSKRFKPDSALGALLSLG